MTGNRFGHTFSFTTWGESHGEAIGCVVDGVPPLIPLTEADIQVWLDKRKPAQNKFTTQRKESDTVKILSGVFEGVTTGTPISLIIYNEDQRSKDYGDISQKFRPGHADYTYQQKYGIRDYRGGGRSSARETAMRVAAGAIARKILGDGVRIQGALVQMGTKHIDRSRWDWHETHNNPFWCPDALAAKEWEDYLSAIRKDGSSVGAMIEVVAEGVPAGWGEPVYDKLDADIAKGIMSINAVKSVEIGDGAAVASLQGEQNADEIRRGENGEAVFSTNHAGGILGGISSGQPVRVRFAIKPTSSILNPVDTIDIQGNDTTIITKGRHDPCVGIRAVPVGEAMLACVLADHYLRQKTKK
ncbi:MAG: chorismate synthase [Alphaproteobacteria bacterium]|nr:chorismate synthase [Alphaproteobacteria bacterium]